MVYTSAVTNPSVAVRPVFYLTTDTSFVMDDESAIGSKEHPYRIETPKTTLLEVCGESGNLIECFKNINDQEVTLA